MAQKQNKAMYQEHMANENFWFVYSHKTIQQASENL